MNIVEAQKRFNEINSIVIDTGIEKITVSEMKSDDKLLIKPIEMMLLKDFIELSDSTLGDED